MHININHLDLVVLLIYRFRFNGLDKALESAFLARAQVVLKMLFRGPHLQVGPVLGQWQYFYMIERLM